MDFSGSRHELVQLSMDLSAPMPAQVPGEHRVEAPVAPEEPARAEPQPAREMIEEAPVPTKPFGTWLLEQKGHRREWIANLAKAAGVDTSFPKRGDPEAVRARMTAMGADGDAFEAIDDAEREWEQSC